jgi:hypothetical protein
LKETVMGVALSLLCILDGWADLILLYSDFNIWCKEYPSLKEKLYRFSVFKETLEETCTWYLDNDLEIEGAGACASVCMAC